MVFNGDTDEQDIVHLLNDLTGMDNGVYTLKAKARDCNTASRVIWSWIHEAYGGWQYDDANNTTDFPTARTSVQANQRDYSLPSELLNVKGIEVKTTGGVWQRLLPVTEEQIRDFMSEVEFMKTASQPMYYTVYSNSVKIYPSTNYTQTDSLRVSYERGATTFASTDTTKTPGFNSQFHDAIAYGAGFFFSRYKTIPQKNDLAMAWMDFEKRIKSYYMQRWAEKFPPRMMVNDVVKEYQ